MMVKKLFTVTVGACAIAAIAGCSGSGNSPQPVTSVNPLQSKLQLAVGTANIFGDMPTAALTGLNVVTTFRQPTGAQAPGDTAALVNTPSLTGPFTVPTTTGAADDFGATIATGPASGEAGKSTIGATPQQPSGSTTIPPTTLGVAGGATGLGLEPFNYSVTGNPSSGAAGAPATFVPYAVPAYDALAATSAGDPNAFIPWGGPPAFDPNKDGKGARDNLSVDPSILGVSEGLDVFAGAKPATGTYTLNVNIVTSNSPGTGSVQTTANLRSAALLPAVTPPTAVSFDGNGGGSFAATLPAGVTEGYIQIVDVGPPQPASGAAVKSCNGSDVVHVYYTFHITASGTSTLPATSGPGNPGTTTPSICTAAQNTASNMGTASPADQITLQLIGFDYPAFAASYPNSNGNPAPTLAGPSGQADITISSQGAATQSATGAAIRIDRSQIRTRQALSLPRRR